MTFTTELINGFVLGLEHLSYEDVSDDVNYVVVLHLAMFRFCFIKYKDD